MNDSPSSIHGFSLHLWALPAQALPCPETREVRGEMSGLPGAVFHAQSAAQAFDFRHGRVPHRVVPEDDARLFEHDFHVRQFVEQFLSASLAAPSEMGNGGDELCGFFLYLAKLYVGSVFLDSGGADAVESLIVHGSPPSHFAEHRTPATGAFFLFADQPALGALAVWFAV